MSKVLEVVALLLLIFLSALECSRIRLNAKLLGRTRVSSHHRGLTVHAYSASHCLARCNKKTNVVCDAINFYRPSGKCMLIDRCAMTTVQYHSSEYFFYSKRPQILSEGYQFDPSTESCMKLMTTRSDYASADDLCAAENGRLVTLKTASTNELARTLLKASKARYAWIGLRDIGFEGNPSHSDGSRALEGNFFNPSSQHWRNITHKNCWALQVDGRWAEFSCKKRQIYSICEVPLF